ncbi:MAG: transposase [Spirochaetales bacterium]|jgi:transposase|nr:transposase [Spirochaetales bacterium]
MKKRQKYTAKQKAQIVLELLKEEKSVAQISSEYKVHPNQLYRWKKQGTVQFHEVFEDRHKEVRELEQDHQKKLNQLYIEIGQLTTQVNWLKKKSGIEHIEK